jgi:hypothetical protein
MSQQEEKIHTLRVTLEQSSSGSEYRTMRVTSTMTFSQLRVKVLEKLKMPKANAPFCEVILR